MTCRMRKRLASLEGVPVGTACEVKWRSISGWVCIFRESAPRGPVTGDSKALSSGHGIQRTTRGPNLFVSHNGRWLQTWVATSNLGLAGEKFGAVLRLTRITL